MQNNLLTGTIPPNLKFPLSFWFDVSHNRLSGTIPETLNDVTIPNIRILDLNNNQLSGSIPANFVNLGAGRTRRIDLANNNLGGNFPEWKTIKFLSTLLIGTVFMARSYFERPNHSPSFVYLLLNLLDLQTAWI